MGQKLTQFEVESHCGGEEVQKKCNINWTVSSNSFALADLGGVKFGEFESNGDIAGIGVLLSIAIPTGVMTGIALLIWIGRLIHLNETRTGRGRRLLPSPHGNSRQQVQAPMGTSEKPSKSVTFSEISYDFYETTLIAMSDYQMIFAAAVVLHFVEIGKCNLSMYHFNIGINLITIALANILVTLVFVRDFWKTPLSSISRLVIFGVLLFFQGKILLTLKSLADKQGTVEARPRKPRKDSLTFLPAMCFLDPDLLSNVIVQMNEPLEFRKDKARIVGDVTPDRLWIAELVLWGITVVFYGFLLFYRLTGLFKIVRRRLQQRKQGSGGKYQLVKKKQSSQSFRRIAKWLPMAVWIFCFTIAIYRLIHVFHVREWVLFSGWMKDIKDLGNPETGFRSFGQVAALCTMAGFVIVAWDKVIWQSAEDPVLDFGISNQA